MSTPISVYEVINAVTLLSKSLILLGKKKLMFVNLQKNIVELYEI
jgi:hypothetical protein